MSSEYLGTQNQKDQKQKFNASLGLLLGMYQKFTLALDGYNDVCGNFREPAPLLAEVHVKQRLMDWFLSRLVELIHALTNIPFNAAASLGKASIFLNMYPCNVNKRLVTS